MATYLSLGETAPPSSLVKNGNIMRIHGPMDQWIDLSKQLLYNVRNSPMPSSNPGIDGFVHSNSGVISTTSWDILVGSFNPSENIFVSWDYYSQYMEKKQTTNQYEYWKLIQY